MLPQDVLSLKILLAGLIAWLGSQLLKSIIYSVKKKRFEFSAFFALGGMPSSHTATAVAIATSIFYVQGFSPLFVASVFMTILIIIDVMTMRWSILEHTRRINELMAAFGGKANVKPIKEFKGHSYREVIAGAILGFLVAVLVFL